MKWIKPDPMDERRNPFQVYMLALAAVSGLGALVPGNTQPNSVDATLQQPYILMWGGLLLLGGVLALAGMYWPWDARDGLLMKRLGFIALAIPTLAYSASVIFIVGMSGFMVAASCLGFAAACISRAREVNRHIHAIIRATERDSQ